MAIRRTSRRAWHSPGGPPQKRHIVLRGGYSIFYNGSIYGDLPGRLASQPPFAQSNSILTSLDYPLRLATGFIRASTKLINNSIVIDRYYKDGLRADVELRPGAESEQDLDAGTQLHGHQGNAAGRAARA